MTQCQGVPSVQEGLGVLRLPTFAFTQKPPMPTLDISQIAVWSFHTLLALSIFYALAMTVQHHWNLLTNLRDRRVTQSLT